MILNEALKLKDTIVNWRRDLHKFPETGLILPKTAAYVMSRLDEMGISYKTYPNHSGIVGLIGNGKGKTIALRADMDGLKLSEETNLPFKSENDNMHACGHDAHTAILLGAAKILKQNEDQINGTIKLLFQPAEEGPGGAEPMVKDGVMEDPKVDAIYALHVVNHKDMPAGAISFNYKAMYAADDQVYIKIIGKGGHGSQPQQCIDPVVIASQVIIGLQQIVSREVSPFIQSVITIASVNIGRQTTNIISDYAEILGTIRNTNLETREYVLQRIEEIVAGITKGFRAEYELKYFDSYPPVINSKELTEKFVESAKKVIPAEHIFDKQDSSLGGEDAAFFFEKAPGTYFRLNVAKKDGSEIYPNHNTKFDIDDSKLYIGTALLTQTVTDLLNEK